MAVAARPGVSEAAALRRLREAERRRLSRLLHDEAGPALCAAGLTAELLRSTLAAPTAQQEQLFEKLSQALEAAVKTVRLLSQEADPHLAQRRGLEGGLRLLAEALGAEWTAAASLAPVAASIAAAACELVRDTLLALGGSGARLAVFANTIRIEATVDVDLEMESALRAAARAAGLGWLRRKEAQRSIIEIQLEENG